MYSAMDISDLIEYIAGRDLSKQDLIRAWLSESEENRQEYFRLKEILALKVACDCSSDDALNSAVSGIRSRIRANSSRRRYRRSLAFAWSATACMALFIAVGALVRFLPRGGTVVLANDDEPVTLYSLPDGTRVYLRQGGELAYGSSFNLKDRKVSIMGEAYLDVARDEDRPFVVNTPNVGVKVLGTAFNVRCDEDDTEVVLERGKVALCNDRDVVLAELLPGNRAVVNEYGGVALSSVQTSSYTKWRYNYKIYDSCTFDDLVSMMENRYDVRFIYDPSKFRNNYFRLAVSESDTLEDMLSMMEYIVQVQYERKGRNIYVK